MVNSAISRLELECRGLEELEEVGAKIISFAQDFKVWLFVGDMGAGKTTLIKFLCKAFGSQDTITSPTYSIVNEYRDRNDNALYHFDFYRIKDEDEAIDIGAEEYFYSGSYCFIEWPSKVPSLLPEVGLLQIDIQVVSNNERKIVITRHD